MLVASSLSLQSFNTLQIPSSALVWSCVFSLAMMLPTLVLLITDTRVLDDELLWLKPLKFQISMAVFCFTIAIAVETLPQELKSSLFIRIPTLAVAVTAVYELLFLAIQAGRGKRSHFNSETLFDQVGGSIMAAGATILVGGAMLIGLVILFHCLSKGWDAFGDPLALSFAFGLIIGGFLGGYTGSFIGMNAGPFVGEYSSTDPTVPLFGWSQTIGDLRIAHFFGLHTMQALPLLALGLLIFIPPNAASALIFIAGAGWIWLTLAALSTAQAGQPPFFF